MEDPNMINISIGQLIIAFLSILVSIAALIIAILSYIKVDEINKRQISRDEDNYLLSMIVVPYNLLETDLMLLAQGTIDLSFNKIDMDKDTLLSLCKTKSYARVHDNEKLYRFLNGIIIGEEKNANIGKLIDDYFAARNLIIKIGGDISKEGKRIREIFMPLIHKYRNYTIKEIKRLNNGRQSKKNSA